jgi:hypothetical protein
MVGRHRAAQSVGGVRLKCTANGRNLRLFSFQLNRIALYIGIGLLGLYYVFVTFATQPLSLAILPPLLAATLLTLWRNRRQAAEQSPEAPEPVTLRRAVTLLLIPLTASAVYAAAFVAGITLPGLQIVYLLLTPVGFIAFAVSVYRVWRGQAAPSLSQTAAS